MYGSPLQVSTLSAYDCATLVKTQTDTHTDIQTELLTAYAISSARWAENFYKYFFVELEQAYMSPPPLRYCVWDDRSTLWLTDVVDDHRLSDWQRMLHENITALIGRYHRNVAFLLGRLDRTLHLSHATLTSDWKIHIGGSRNSLKLGVGQALEQRECETQSC